VDNPSFCERALALVCGQERASEIVGDLLEQGSGTKTLWLMLPKLYLAFGWRWVAGVLLTAAGLFGLGLGLAQLAVATSGPLEPQWTAYGNAMTLAALCTWSVAILNAVRFGWRDVLSRVGGMSAILLTCAAACVWMPHVRNIAIGVVVICFAICLANNSLRKAWLSLLLVACAYASAFVLSMKLLPRTPGHVAPAVLMVELFSCWFLSLAFEAWTLAQVRRHVLLKNSFR
jgi:hypothetical protein